MGLRFDISKNVPSLDDVAGLWTRWSLARSRWEKLREDGAADVLVAHADQK